MKHLVLAAAILLPVATVNEPLPSNPILIRSGCFHVEIIDTLTDLYKANKADVAEKMLGKALADMLCLQVPPGYPHFLVFKPSKVVRRFKPEYGPIPDGSAVVEGNLVKTDNTLGRKFWTWQPSSEIDAMLKGTKGKRPKRNRRGEQEA